jgi:GGDEF domain-containing protein
MSVLDEVNLFGAAASIIALIPIVASILRRVAAAPGKAVREFWFLYRSWPNIILTLCVGILLGDATYRLWGNRRLLLGLYAPVTAVVLLLSSFFVRQSRTLLRQLILHHIERAVRMSSNICSAIKFDIDLLVAVNDYSYATGHAIVELVHRTLRKHQKALKAQGSNVVSIELPESDEVIWILPNQTVERAADIADSIRREIKRDLGALPYYAEACAFVCQKLRTPPLTEEERGGIGTLSAGVAAYSQGSEALLGEISSAIKEAKFRGRNRTIIYQREKQSVVRAH